MPRQGHFWAGQMPGEQNACRLGREASMREKAMWLSGEGWGTCWWGHLRNQPQGPSLKEPGAGQSRATAGRTPPTWSFSCLSAFSSLPPAGSLLGLGFIHREVKMGNTWGACTYSQAWRHRSPGDIVDRRSDQEQMSGTHLGLPTGKWEEAGEGLRLSSGYLLGRGRLPTCTHTPTVHCKHKWNSSGFWGLKD